VLLNRRNADFELLALVDFALLELGQLRVEAIDLRVQLINAAIKPRFAGGKVVFGRHVFDDVFEHFTDFFECRFFCCHMREVYHAVLSVHAGGFASSDHFLW
jgi:hypothetical protein